ncbi:hypothetical protein GQ457_02G032720 [Hibiscus cannabinus]
MLNAYWRFEMVSYCWVLVWDKFGVVLGYFGCESDAKSSYNVELMFAASFDSKMGCLYSVFDVKKQGKTVWVVRARNWKLRRGENRLSGLLEGVSHRSLSFQAYALFPTMQIASLGEGKEARRIHLDLCSSTHLDCLWVIWYALVRLGGVSENLHASMKHD